MKFHIEALVSILIGATSAWAAIPDFQLEAYRGNDKFPLVGVLVKAPAGHHFNLKAPFSAKTVATSTDLKLTSNTDREIRFEIEDPSINKQDSIAVSAYLCDDAKTYCVKKSGSIALASAGAPPVNKIVRPDVELPNAKVAAKPAAATAPAESPAPELTVKKKISKDEHGFWNDVETVQKLAKKFNRPILIDFYGIWCPPCNMYNESVFPTEQFSTLAKKFVLLKVDADQIESWSIKSRFKIGGYPTIVFATPDLDEISRVVGFIPISQFASRMNNAIANRSTKLEDRVAAEKDRYLDSLGSLVELKMEQKDYKAALQYAGEGRTIKADDAFFRLAQITIQSKDDPKILKQADTIAFLKSVWDRRTTLGSSPLLLFEDLIASNTDSFSPEQIIWAVDVVDQLKTRVNERTLHLDQKEMSLADLDAMRVDLYEAAKKNEQEKQAVKDTITSYRKLMKIFGGEKSRGLNLELAYYLGKDGQVAEATKIYESFMKQYPKEFTYYYAAARHFQEVVKDLKRARECADNAVKYSYGDNQLRSMARLLSIRAAQGEGKEGIEQAKQVLAKVPSYDGLSVRTGRYVAALEKAIEKAGGEVKKK